MSHLLRIFSWNQSQAENEDYDFMLDDWTPAVPVKLPAGLTPERLLEFKPFTDWQECLRESLSRQGHENHPLHEKQFRLANITVTSFSTTDAYDKAPFSSERSRILFVKLHANIVGKDNQRLPKVVFLRGGSVTMLMILIPEEQPTEKYVVLTEQPRPAAGSLRFQELPAGMLDGDRNFSGAAAKEIEEEVRIKIHPENLVNMTELALKKNDQCEEPLQKAMYPSPGACDEFISIFLYEQEMPRAEIMDLRDRLTGVKAEQEQIRVRLIPYQHLPRICARDAKTLAAWSLYEYLHRIKELPLSAL